MKFIPIFLICGVYFTSLMLPAAQESDSLQVKAEDETKDSLINTSEIFIPPDQRYFQPTTDQMIKLWVLQHQSQIWDQVELSDNQKKGSNNYGFRNMFKSYNNTNFTYPGLELRESSLYIPQNVRDFTDFKMGRDRYLPVFNPVLIGFMLYHVSRYAHNFFNKEDDFEVRDSLSEIEKFMLVILENEYPLETKGWYNRYIMASRDSSMTINEFGELVRKLEEKAILKPRQFEDGTVKYYPEKDSSYIKMKLKK